MKEQLTVRLEPEVLRAAKEQARRLQISVSAVVADAATEALVGAHQDRPEAKMLTLLERLSNQLYKLTRHQHADLAIQKEMLGLFVRAYFNHTPPIPESALEPSLLSGKARYERLLDALAKNLRRGSSTLGEIAEAPTDVSAPAPAATDHPNPPEAPDNVPGESSPSAAPTTEAVLPEMPPVPVAPPAKPKRWSLFGQTTR